MTAHRTRLESFRIRNGIRPSAWAAKAGLSRPTLQHVREGNDPHVATIRAIVRAASEILGRAVRVSEVFNVGEGTLVPATPEARRIASSARRKTFHRYGTRLDRILRGERIMPNDFANRIGIVRQSLLRFRCGRAEPCQSTLATMVATLRRLTGKAYLASHLYDVGEGLAEAQRGMATTKG